MSFLQRITQGALIFTFAGTSFSDVLFVCSETLISNNPAHSEAVGQRVSHSIPVDSPLFAEIGAPLLQISTSKSI